MHERALNLEEDLSSSSVCGSKFEVHQKLFRSANYKLNVSSDPSSGSALRPGRNPLHRHCPPLFSYILLTRLYGLLDLVTLFQFREYDPRRENAKHRHSKIDTNASESIGIGRCLHSAGS